MVPTGCLSMACHKALKACSIALKSAVLGRFLAWQRCHVGGHLHVGRAHRPLQYLLLLLILIVAELVVVLGGADWARCRVLEVVETTLHVVSEGHDARDLL